MHLFYFISRRRLLCSLLVKGFLFRSRIYVDLYFSISVILSFLLHFHTYFVNVIKNVWQQKNKDLRDNGKKELFFYGYERVREWERGQLKYATKRNIIFQFLLLSLTLPSHSYHIRLKKIGSSEKKIILNTFYFNYVSCLIIHLVL